MVNSDTTLLKNIDNALLVASGGGLVWQAVNETVTDFPASALAPPGGCRISPSYQERAITTSMKQYMPPFDRQT